MNALFVAGTDTGVGKTVVTGLLLRYLHRQGIDAVAQKWVQTGVRRGGEGDIDTIVAMAGAAYPPAVRALMEPYRFSYPASPHLAAARARRRIVPGNILRAYRQLRRRYEFVLVEGSGGLLVPLTKKTVMLDLVTRLRIPVLLVAGNKLGAINHTLLSIRELRRRGIPFAGMIFSDAAGATPRAIVRDNPEIVAALAGERAVGGLPAVRDPQTLARRFARIASQIVGS